MRSALLLVLPCVALACADGSSSDDDGVLDDGHHGVPTGAVMWAVVHPTMAPPEGPGIYVYDRERGEVTGHLPLPDGLKSPHALGFDGTSLWIAGGDDSALLYELDPTDGAIRSTIANVRTEGVTADGNTLWVANYQYAAEKKLMQITHDGCVLREIPITRCGGQDVTIDDDASLYYLCNSDVDELVSVDMTSEKEAVLAEHVAAPSAPYAMAYDGAHVVVRDSSGTDNTLNALDPSTGERLSASPINIQGWITAIAFDRYRQGSYDISACDGSQCAAPCASDAECAPKEFCNIGCCAATIY